ncbi:MAG: glycosyltransferase [Planctomycetes bacterium]|nr:glycosyltransferase [Planctomycetota bacterium]MCH8118431.1 glycosyltransferase [Planctomycetota bacterium]
MQRFDPIVIYQMGKVGSKTIQASLEKLNLPNKIYHTHFLSWSNIKQIEDHYSSIPGTNVRLDHCKDIRSLIDSTAGNIRWKIITLVRDPVARDISDVFHNIKRDLSHVTNVDPESAFNDINSHILKTFADFNESTDYACTWFDKEIKDVFNFDIYANDFNKSTGYQIYKVQDADILLIRLEDLSRCCHDAFREFLGVPDFSIVKDNVSEKKWYQGLYRRVLDSISIPDSDLERIYKSRYCRHFYTGDEINHFKKKWSGEKTEIKSVTVASSQRNSSNSGKILIVHPEGNINSNINLTGIVEILCENGYKVDIYSLKRFYTPQHYRCAGASLFLLDKPEKSVENGTFILEDPKLNSQEKIISYINENFKSYDLVIGVDRGIIEAALIAQNREIPCGLISYEIFFEEETSKEFKQEEIEACKCLDFIVCQDALRAKYLSIENKIALEKIINIPVAGRGIKKGEKNSYLYDSLGINKDKKIALFMGTVAQWSMAGYILESAKQWSDDWVLVVHNRHGLDQGVRPYYAKYKCFDNIYFSLEPIADPNQLDCVIHSADVGIAFYEPTYQSKYTGNNIKYLGMASGKIATYLQHGLPIIINEIGQMSDYVRKYGLGLVVDDNGYFSTPLTNGQLLKFRLNCLEFFEKRLDLNHTIVPLLKIIQRLSDKQAITVSSENSLALGTKDFLAGKVEHPVINSAEKYNLSGEKLLGRKDIDGALNAFKKAIEVAPHFIAAHNNIGKAYLQKGELANALKHFTNALKINPYDLATVLNCGQVLTSHGLVQEARSLYMSYLQENPNDNKVIQALENLNCEKRIEGWDDVIPEYKKDLIAGAEHVVMQQNQGDVESRKYLVSAIVSMYNSQRFIRGCLEGLINQTIFKMGKLEIVVVNSGSEQNEDAVVRQFQQQYDNIKYIKIEKRETIYKSWNRGAQAASGKYLVNTNTDDRLRQDALEIIADTLEANEHIGAIYIDQIVTNYPNETFEKHHTNGFIERPDFSKEVIAQRNPCGPQVMWRKKLHELIGYFKPHYEVAGDWDFWLRIVFDTDYTITHIPELLGLYYKNPQGLEIGPGKQKERLKEIDEIRNKYGRVFLAQGVDNNHNCSKSEELHDKETTYFPRHTPGSDFKKSMRILLTTSAAPTQSPFSTSEKRPPIGVGFLISVLRNAGHEVFFIDNYLQPNDFLDTDYLWKNEIDYVGIYANTICLRDTLRMMHKLEHLRQTNKWNGKIIVGGPHTTVAVNTIPDFVDYVVQGEGEQAILDIVEGKVTQRLVSYPRIENLDALPMPAWDYFVKLPYNWNVRFFEDQPVFTMNTSRGCPFRCQFCSVGSIWGKKYTYFSAERIVSDIEYLIKNYGTKGIYFREDNFTLNKERLKKFCNLMIEKRIKISWVCESRVSNLTRDIVELMSRAGLRGFYFGVESGSQRMLDLTQKDITVEQIRYVFKWCHEFDVKTAASVIVGVPDETELDILQTNQLLKEIKPTVTWFNVFVGIPDSKLYRLTLDKKLYEYIDDRGLVYLQGHNDRVQHYYNGGFNAFIPYQEKNKDMTNRPKVSVLISAYNSEKYIEQALESIYNQTYQDFEVIIVDDGSTDRTSEILVNMKDPRTFICRNSVNKGLTKSLNIGLKLCRGEYVARMDADDISHPQRFEKQVGFLNENPECVALGSWYGRIDSNGEVWGSKETPIGYEDIKKNLPIGNCVGHGSMMLRRSSLVEIGGYNEKYTYAQDYDLLLRLSEVGEIRNLGEYLYNLRSWPGAVSATRAEQQNEYAELALQESVEREFDTRPVNRTMLYRFADRALAQFVNSKYISCIITLNTVGKRVKGVERIFRNYDLLRGLAYFAVSMKAESRGYLNREIQNYNNAAARQFISDYFENQIEADVRNWYLENSKLYDLRLIDLENESCQQRQNNNISEPYVSEQQSEQKGIRQSSCCKQSEPLVSVIMPAYNAAEHIAEAIESVLIQNYRNLELIVVNDGSTDDTKDIVFSFKDERIKYFYHENSGLAATHNTGIEKSEGSFLIKLDHDDMMTADFIAAHLAEFEKHPDVDLVYCDDCLIDENSKPIRVIERPEYTDRRLLIRDLFHCGFPVVPFRTCIRRSVFDKIGFFDEELLVGEDYDMMRRFVKAGLKIHHLKGAMYLRRMTSDSLSRNCSAQKAKSHFDVVKRFTDTFTYDELFPDVEWDKIAPEMRQLHAKCLTAGTYLAIGQEYVKTNAPECSRTAFDRACSELNDCVKIDPENQGLRQLLQKSKLIRARYTEAPQQVVSK